MYISPQFTQQPIAAKKDYRIGPKASSSEEEVKRVTKADGKVKTSSQNKNNVAGVLIDEKEVLSVLFRQVTTIIAFTKHCPFNKKQDLM